MMNSHRAFFIYRRILNEQYRNQHRHLPDCQKADRQDNLYRPCAFQPDRKRDNISTVERGMSFPRCEKLIILLNGLEVSADAIFCDVLEHSTSYKSSELSEKLASLSPQAQKRILQMVELMIQQETADNG